MLVEKAHSFITVYPYYRDLQRALLFARERARTQERTNRTRRDRATASMGTHVTVYAYMYSPYTTRNPIRATSPRGRVWMTLRRSFFSLAIYVCAMIDIQYIDICIMYPYDGINVSMFCSLCKVVVDAYDVVGATDAPRNPPLIETLLFRVGRRVCTYASTPRAKKHRVD